MTRRWLLAVTVAVVSSCPAAQPAYALFGVGDIVFDPSVYEQAFTTVVKLEQQVSVLKQQLDQQISTLNAIAHLPDAELQSIAGQLNISQFRSPITTDPAAVAASIAGLGTLSGTAQQFLQRNGSYAAPGQDFLALQLAARGNSVAAVQGMVNELYVSAAQHATALRGIEGQLAGSQDAKAVADIQARIALESAHLQAQQVQAASLVTFNNAQQRSEDAQLDRVRRCQFDEVLRAGRSQTPLASSSCDRVASTSGTGGSYAVASAGTGAVVSDASPGVGGAMSAQPWGQQASQYASQMGVNPAVMEGVCQIESGCRNVAGTGTISGPFQMSDGTYNQTIRQAVAQNPSLAGSVVGKSDPATESIAAAQYMKEGAVSLQSSGIANPTGLDVRGYYNFGPTAGANIANASDGTRMAAVLPAGTNLAANGITSSMTVGQWRQMVTTKMGASAASAPVLLSGA